MLSCLHQRTPYGIRTRDLLSESQISLATRRTEHYLDVELTEFRAFSKSLPLVVGKV